MAALKEPQQIQLERVSTIDALVNALRNDIYDGVWEPDAQITEQELIQRYNVSRNSVREALVLLVNQRYLEKRINKGVFVRTFNQSEIEDMFFARKLLEEHAVRDLAKKQYAPEGLVAAANNLRKRKKKDPWSIVIMSDMNFHKTLVDGLGSPKVSMLYGNLLVDFELINRQPSKTTVDMDRIYETHICIINAIEDGNVAEAVEALNSHLSDACNTQICEWCTADK